VRCWKRWSWKISLSNESDPLQVPNQMDMIQW
jgi:hypothetical protein